MADRLETAIATDELLKAYTATKVDDASKTAWWDAPDYKFEPTPIPAQHN